MIVAPAAVVTAGLVLLALDVTGLSAGIMRAWTSVMTQSLGWLHG